MEVGTFSPQQPAAGLYEQKPTGALTPRLDPAKVAQMAVHYFPRLEDADKKGYITQDSLKMAAEGPDEMIGRVAYALLDSKDLLQFAGSGTDNYSFDRFLEVVINSRPLELYKREQNRPRPPVYGQPRL